MVDCKFLLYVSVEIDPFSCEQNRHFSTQTNFQYLGLVNVSVITGVLIAHFAFIYDTLKLTIFTIIRHRY